MLLPTLNALESKIKDRLISRWNSGEMWKEFLGLEGNMISTSTKGIEYQMQFFLLLGWVTEKAMLQLILVKTRQYAKKQLTWLVPKHYTPVATVEDILNIMYTK